MTHATYLPVLFKFIGSFYYIGLKPNRDQKPYYLHIIYATLSILSVWRNNNQRRCKSCIKGSHNLTGSWAQFKSRTYKKIHSFEIFDTYFFTAKPRNSNILKICLNYCQFAQCFHWISFAAMKLKLHSKVLSNGTLNYIVWQPSFSLANNFSLVFYDIRSKVKKLFHIGSYSIKWIYSIFLYSLKFTQAL